MGRDCVVGIAIRYGLDVPGIESRWGSRFSAPVQFGPGAHPACCRMGTGSFPRVKRPGRDVDHPAPPTICRMRLACWISRLCNTHWLSTATMFCTNAPQCYVIPTLPVLLFSGVFKFAVCCRNVLPASIMHVSLKMCPSRVLHSSLIREIENLDPSRASCGRRRLSCDVTKNELSDRLWSTSIRWSLLISLYLTADVCSCSDSAQ